VDLCIALGGDGTFLHMAGLFGSDEPLPPAVSFAMGTLGFLTPFDVKDFKVRKRTRKRGSGTHPRAAVTVVIPSEGVAPRKLTLRSDCPGNPGVRTSRELRLSRLLHIAHS
jgi:NAD kinase